MVTLQRQGKYLVLVVILSELRVVIAKVTALLRRRLCTWIGKTSRGILYKDRMHQHHATEDNYAACTRHATRSYQEKSQQCTAAAEQGTLCIVSKAPLPSIRHCGRGPLPAVVNKQSLRSLSMMRPTDVCSCSKTSEEHEEVKVRTSALETWCRIVGGRDGQWQRAVQVRSHSPTLYSHKRQEACCRFLSLTHRCLGSQIFELLATTTCQLGHEASLPPVKKVPTVAA